MEENKKELKSKYGDAKTLGLLVNESRDKINELKRMLENEKCSSFSSDANPSHEKQPENISKLSAMIEEEKSRSSRSSESAKIMRHILFDISMYTLRVLFGRKSD
eukprot:TRINITY_DN5168_c0_g1_i1.p1 TRINITY_DN5168_c0_g1~~TRINITY_DN5168_c0_g1_i1.p1  ORF type:complete len:105 (+),score=18.36 TRINITY_DN5168_c0_g1_i1:507-821(+)